MKYCPRCGTLYVEWNRVCEWCPEPAPKLKQYKDK